MVSFRSSSRLVFVRLCFCAVLLWLGCGYVVASVSASVYVRAYVYVYVYGLFSVVFSLRVACCDVLCCDVLDWFWCGLSIRVVCCCVALCVFVVCLCLCGVCDALFC